MTVVEYDGRIVVVDCGLRFPTAEMMGIDLVLPDFTYLRERADDIEAFVITHGHEDHLGALPWVLRELGQDRVPVVYGGQLTIAMARSKLDEHKLREAELEVLPIGRGGRRPGPFEIELVHLTHSIPDAARRRADHRARDRSSSPATTSSTRRRSAARPADVSRLAELGRDGPAAALRRLDERRPARAGRRASRSSARTCASSSSARKGRIVVTSFASNIHRVQQVIDAAAELGRKVALVGRSMRKNVNIGRTLGHIDAPEGIFIQPREIDQFPDEKLVDHLDRAPRASRCRRCAGWPTATTRRSSCTRATPSSSPPRRSPATSARSTRRSTASTTSAATSSRPADAPIHASGHGYAGGDQADAQPHAPALRDADARRLQAPAAARRSSPRPSASRREHLPRRERPAARDRRARAPASASSETAGHGLRRRRRHRRRRRRRAARPPHALAPTASSSSSPRSPSRTARPSCRPRCSPAASRSSTSDGAFIDELREAVEDALDRAAEQRITEIELLQQLLHDDLAQFIYDRLKRRPMVLPVVVEV